MSDILHPDRTMSSDPKSGRSPLEWLFLGAVILGWAVMVANMNICANGKCSRGWAGTIFSSPMWAGFAALANQQAVANGKPLVGFLNPTLYALSHGKTCNRIFHDVIGGRSGKYYAVKSFDLVTGLGSPNGQALIDALAGTP